MKRTVRNRTEWSFRAPLPSLMRGQLESVFFFNPKQSNWSRRIAQVVDQYGIPEIVESCDYITIILRDNNCAQTLFSVSPRLPDRLTGVIIYTRLKIDELFVLHLALAERRPARATAAQNARTPQEFLALISAFMKLARSIVGVKRLRFAYWNLAIPVV